VVLVSGAGTNLRALARAIDDGTCRATLRAVIADRPCDALRWAEARGIPTQLVRPRNFGDRATWDAALADAIAESEPTLVVLAGFMRIVGDRVLARFGGQVVNVHPSLLPRHPGLDAPGQALTAGDTRSGCTVHLVDRGVDTGPVLAQASCAVRAGDTAATLHARIQPLEHALLPAVLDSLLAG